MADPTQNVGTPALNPPPPDEQQSLADTPSSTDNYDVVIGGLGLMLFRDQDDSAPDKIFKTEPADYKYAPVFLSRTNTTGDLSDSQQEFYMQFVQNDWSGGLGQKYFYMDSSPQSSMYYNGDNLSTTQLPGSVTVGPNYVVNTSLSGGVALGAGQLGLNLPASPVQTTPTLVNFSAVGVSGSTAVYQLSTDGGNSWSTQPTSSTPTFTQLVDIVYADGGWIYILDCTGGSTSHIRKISAPSGSGVTIAWDTSTNVTGNALNAITYWNGSLYGANNIGQFGQITSGSTAAITLIKDFGQGVIVSLAPSPVGVYILYYSVQGQYKLFLFDGTAANVSEVSRLPRGFTTHPLLETQGASIGTPGQFTQFYCTHNMLWQDGVLYICGLLPARDFTQSQRGGCPFRSALLYYASGNSGIIWQSDYIAYNYWTAGGGGAITGGNNGLIYFQDLPNQKMMSYNPGTAGVAAEATMALSYTSTTTGTVGATMTSTATNISLSGLPPIGVITIGSEQIQILNEDLSANFNVIRGWNGTTAAAHNNGVTWTCTTPTQPFVHSLLLDQVNNVISWFSYQTRNGSYFPLGGANDSSFLQVQLRPSGAGLSKRSAHLFSSQYDFNSSLDKYFKDVVWDGSLTQEGQIANASEQAGTVDLYYKLNGVADTASDSGLTLIQTAAQPGTRYPIGVTGRSISIMTVLNAATATSTQTSVGPVMNRLTLRGVPITPGFRYRDYQIALFSQINNKAGFPEPRTPAVLRRNLETMISAGSVVAVSDSGMTNVNCVFDASNCFFREMKPDEYIAYISVREI